MSKSKSSNPLFTTSEKMRGGDDLIPLVDVCLPSHFCMSKSFRGAKAFYSLGEGSKNKYHSGGGGAFFPQHYNFYQKLSTKMVIFVKTKSSFRSQNAKKRVWGVRQHWMCNNCAYSPCQAADGAKPSVQGLQRVDHSEAKGCHALMTKEN